MKNQKGFIQIIIIVFLIVGIIAVSAVSYFILKPNNKSTSQTQVEESQETTSNSTPGATAEPPVQEVGSISTSTNTKTIEKELNDTDLDSIDSDLESLETSFDSF